MMTEIQKSEASKAGVPRRLPLSSLQEVARGVECSVYEHPADSRLLIKVAQPVGDRDPLFRRLHTRFGKFRPLLNELEEFLALQIRAPGDLDLIERIIGVAETDRGPGLVVEALRDRAGQLAPTLRALATGGLTDGMRRELDGFIARLLASDIVVHDTKASNIVYAHDATSDSGRFVLVDGIGNRPDIPLDSFSRRLSRYNKARRIERLRAEVAKLARRKKTP